MTFSNTIHINTECSCDKCSVKRTKHKIHVSRAKLTMMLLAEIRALNGKKVSITQTAEDIAGKIELFLVEEGV